MTGLAESHTSPSNFVPSVIPYKEHHFLELYHLKSAYLCSSFTVYYFILIVSQNCLLKHNSTLRPLLVLEKKRKKKEKDKHFLAQSRST